MARVCANGCGRQIGYDRFFCSKECKNADKATKLARKRAKSRKRTWLVWIDPKNPKRRVKIGLLRPRTIWEVGIARGRFESAVAYPAVFRAAADHITKRRPALVKTQKKKARR